MKKILNSPFILFLVTLPLIVLLFIYQSEFKLFRSLLESDSLDKWQTLNFLLIFFICLSIGFAIFSFFFKSQKKIFIPIILIVACLAFLYFFFFHYNDLVPFSIPRWMNSGLLLFSTGSIMVLILAYSVFALSLLTIKETAIIWKNVVAAVSIPFGIFIFSQFGIYFLTQLHTEFIIHLFIVFMMIATVLFHFFMVKAIYLLLQKKTPFFSRYRLFFIIPFTFVFPMAGLLVNNGFFSHSFASETYIIGNFSNPWFYFLTFINAGLLCLPTSQKKWLQIVVFILKSITYAFTLYFFFVFLPYTPFAIPAIIFAGLGFLIISPLVLFIIHSNSIYHDVKIIKDWLGLRFVIPIFLFSLLIIPLIITWNYHSEKKKLQSMLEYSFYPDYSKKYSFEVDDAKSILLGLNDEVSGTPLFLNNNGTPILSQYYKYIVLDNMMVQFEKRQKMLSIFNYDHFNNGSTNNGEPMRTAQLKEIQKDCYFNAEKNYFISQVELTMQSDSGSLNGEYSTQFEIPVGCYITDFYLYMGNKKVPGILAEKKASSWVYSQIASVNKDPGILFYQRGNLLTLKVFPFTINEKRKCGMTLIHKEPFILNIDNQSAELTDHKNITPQVFNINNATYIPSSVKLSLPLVKRNGYFHFIVDCSNHGKQFKDVFINQIHQLLRSKPEWVKGSKVSFCGTFAETHSITEKWESMLMKYDAGSGFYADYILRKSLSDAYQNGSPDCPIFVFLTRNYENAVLDPMMDLRFTYPDFNYFYVANGDQSIDERFLDNLNLNDSSNTWHQPLPVRKFQGKNGHYFYLTEDSLASIIINDRVSFNNDLLPNSQWEKGVLFEAVGLYHSLCPYQASQDWKKMVKSSFSSGILNRYTSFIALENESQQEMLRRKQKLSLDGNLSLDHGNYSMKMSEPEWLLLLIVGIVMLRFWRTQKKSSRN